MNKSKKSGCLKIIIILILIAGLIAGVLGYLSGGFKDWNFIKKPTVDVPPAEETKEIVSTTIASEKYGTFVVPKNSMAVSTFTPILYRHGTDLSLLKKEIADYYVTLDTNFNINDYDICLHVINNNSTTLKYATKKTGYPNFELYIFNNDIVEYTSLDLEQEAERLYLISKTGNNVPMFTTQKIFVTTLDTEIAYVPMQITVSINSDKGYPLTELMYREMLADESTQITYTYAN